MDLNVVHKLVIKPAVHLDGRQRNANAGPLFEVYYENELVCVSAEPLLGGARALREQGLSGPLEMWDEARPYPRMRSTVEKAASQTVEEGEGVPRFRKHRAFAGRALLDGHLTCPGTTPTCPPETPVLSSRTANKGFRSGLPVRAVR
jgi:hypothetical protein